MITQKNILIILFISIIFVSCGKIDNQSYADADAMVENSKANITTIEVTDLQIILDSTEHKNVVIVDCREPKEYAEKHITGAINVPRGLLEFSPKISNRRNTYYIYSNTDKRASLCCNTLPLLKHKNIILVNGGIEAWLEKYPKLFEEGGEGGAPAPVKEESSGCGG